MRALVLRDYYDISVEERPDPVPGSGQAVVEVIATGICGSDFHGYSGENGRRHPGQIMGHETVGRVRELGVDVAGLTVGQLVTVNPVMSCHACPACLSGQEQWCPRRVVFGVAREIPAAFAERFAVPASSIVPLPEDMPEELGALVEPMAVGYHAVRRGQLFLMIAYSSSAVDRSGRRASSLPGVWESRRWPSPTSAAHAAICVRDLGPKSSTRQQATCRRRYRTGWVRRRPWSWTPSESAGPSLTRSPPPAWGAGSCWSEWVRPDWSSMRTP
jgi:Alcohol dehydrogenase GroES-like domain